MANNLPAFYLCPENLLEAGIKGSGLICWVAEISKQDHVQVVMATVHGSHPVGERNSEAEMCEKNLQLERKMVWAGF